MSAALGSLSSLRGAYAAFAIDPPRAACLGCEPAETPDQEIKESHVIAMQQHVAGPVLAPVEHRLAVSRTFGLDADGRAPAGEQFRLQQPGDRQRIVQVIVAAVIEAQHAGERLA